MKGFPIKLRLFLVSFSLLLWGCASIGLRPTRIERVHLIEIREFCRRNNLNYIYQPFYEEVILWNDSFKIEAKPGFSCVLVNNIPQNLYQEIKYNRGKIFIPSRLGQILLRFKKEKIKDLSSFISYDIQRIVIDPGHGGRDPGAISPWGLKEKDINLSIAKYLYNILRKRGFRVYLTRNSDYFLSLKERVKFARRKKADLFISIHANANPSSRLKGFEVYYASSRFLDTQSKILATAEELYRNEAGILPRKFKNLLGRMVYNENRRRTNYLASAILNSARNLGILTNKTIGAPFYVLKYNICPAVLVEVGYLTNRYEERLLRTALYRKQLALAIAQGIFKLKDSCQKMIAER